jgi:hypothetical protein
MWNKIKELFKAKEAIDTTIPENKPKTNKPNKPKEPKKQVELTPKQKATAAGEPYIAIIKVDLDPNDLNNGAFELDWNDKFIINLIKSGYKIREDDSDQNIVDRWFQNVCRNVALEIYEQDQADPTNRDMRVVRSKDIGNGRSEIS